MAGEEEGEEEEGGEQGQGQEWPPELIGEEMKLLLRH